MRPWVPVPASNKNGHIDIHLLILAPRRWKQEVPKFSFTLDYKEREFKASLGSTLEQS